MTANITKAVKSNFGMLTPAKTLPSTPKMKGGSPSASGAWASPVMTSTSMVTRSTFLSSMADNKLQTLAATPENGQPPRPTYTDLALAKGVTAHRPYTGGDVHPSTAWHAQFEDVNNDSLLDLFIAKGNVSRMPDFAVKDPNNLLLQESDGKFQEAGEAAGVASFAISRGAALTDFNLDGLLDLVVVNRWENAQLWRNTSKNAGRWIEVKLEQPAPNLDAIGSWLEVRIGSMVMRREITVGGGHASGQLGFVHVGLGTAGRVEVRVHWPDGEWSHPYRVLANNFIRIERGKPATQYWLPAPQGDAD